MSLEPHRQVPDPVRSRGVWIALAFATMALAVDLAFVTAASGVLATGAMAVTVLWMAASARIDPRRWRDPAQRRSLFRLEVLLIAIAAGVAVARGLEVHAASIAGADTADAHAEAARLYDVLFVAAGLAAELVMWNLQLFARLLVRLGRKPPVLLAASFGGMILLGTLALCLPWSVEDVRDVSLLDALFTMTSAVCVTGLVVNDVGATYTDFGELMILFGIQCGGLGIMTLGAAAVSLTRDASLRAQAEYATLLDARSLQDLRRIVRTVVASTLVIETVGSIVLWWVWRDDPRLEGRSAVWCAVFHTVSAFCNAGFSLFPANLTPFATSTATQAIVGVLIVLGGIGFPVYLELGRRLGRRARDFWQRRPYVRTRFNLEVRLILVVSALLVAGGAVLIGVLEWRGVLAGMDGIESSVAAVFSSISTRTAGFNTVDFGAMRAPALLCVIGLMWIGGSPNSMAGGIKTTAAAVLFATFVSHARGHEPRLGGRAIGTETIRRATAAASLSFVVVSLTLFGLTLSEEHGFLPLAFESVSAFATVGLSCGITPDLSGAGRCILIATMFVGRLGPLTLAVAIGGRHAHERFRLPAQEITIR